MKIHIIKLNHCLPSEDSFLGEVALNNGLSTQYITSFKKSVREQIKLNDFPKFSLLNPDQDINNLLTELYGNIDNIISGTIKNGDISAYIYKTNDLFYKSIQHCISSMLEPNHIRFIELINQHVEHGLKNAKNNPMVLHFVTDTLFDLDIKDEDLEIIYETIKNPNPKDSKLALAWYLINSKIMNLSKIAEHNSISFATYREFKMQAYATLFQHYGKDINQPEATNNINLFSLLQDAYELKDNKKYWNLINKTKETIKTLHASKQQLAIIKLLRIKTSEKIIELFNALDSNNENQINKAIIDITLRRFNRHHSTLKVIIPGNPSDCLWNKSKAKSNYSFDATEFRTAVYKEYPTFTDDEIKKLELLDLSLHNCAWSNIEKANLAIDKLDNGFDNVVSDYEKFITSDLAATDLESTTKYRAIRRKLLDYVFHVTNSQQCTKLIELDILCLKNAYTNNTQARAYSLLSLDYKEIVLLDSLLTSQDDRLIKLFLLQYLDFSRNSFNFEADPKSAIDFKRRVFAELQLNQYDPQFSQVKAIPCDIIQIEQQLAKIKLFGSYALYSCENNQYKKIWITEVKKMFGALYNDAIIPLPFYVKEIISACQSVQEDVFYFKLCSEYLYSADTIRRDNLSSKDILKIKQELELSDSVPQNKPTELLKALKQALVTQNSTNTAVTRLVIHTLFDDALENLDGQKFANAIIALTQEIDSLIDEIKKIIHKKSDITPRPEKITSMPLLSRFIIRKMYQKLDGLKKSKFDFNELCKFLLAARQIIKDKFGDLTIEKLSSDPKSLLQEYLSPEHDLIDIKIAAMELKETLEDAWLARDTSKFTSTINTATTLLYTFYQARQIKPILISLNFLKQDDLHVLFRRLEINHKDAIKGWLINHYIDHYALNIKLVTIASIKEKDQFKQACYYALGIEIADYIDPTRLEEMIGKDSSLIDSLFTSIRTLANKTLAKDNKEIKINTCERLITFLAKNYCIADKSQFNPTDSDTTNYHELHQIMQAIWHSHIAGHVFSVTVENIKINEFSLAWEGSYGSIMSEYLRTTHLQLFQNPNYSTTIRNNIKPDLIEAIKHGVASNQEDRNKWLESRLEAEQIIAIDVGIYDDGDMGHAVSAVFGKIGEHDIALFSDRGVGVESFSGIKIFKITNSNAKKAVLQKLIATCASKNSSSDSSYQEAISISSATYKDLQNQLNLEELSRIPMFMQLMGNCAFSSSAEPMHLGIGFLCCLKSISQEKPHLTFKDACGVAEENCLELHGYMMHSIYNITLTNLVNFFKDSNKVKIPKELFAHIHIINTYKIKNPQIMSIFNETDILQAISAEDKALAYQDYIEYFALAINDNSSGILDLQEQEYSVHLTTAFLAADTDQEMFHGVYKCIGRSIMFGDKRISPFMLWEFDKEFGSLGTVLSAANIQEIEDDSDDPNVSSTPNRRLLLT